MKVFISHSSNDKKFIRLLKSCLNENDIDTWFDEDELMLGDSLLKKLEEALNESSHFVIILSKASVNSDWVKFELKRAVNNQKSGLFSKIIPIKYRECDVPEVLSELVYADLTREVVLPDGEKVKFISSGFDNFFLRLVKALKSPLNFLSDAEKEEFKKSLQKKSGGDDQIILTDITRGVYLLLRMNMLDEEVYKRQILESKHMHIAVDDINPILLPASIKMKWNLNFGDAIEIIGPSFKSSIAHFVDFRIDDIQIVANSHNCQYSDISMGNYYSVEFDPSKKKISFIEIIGNI